MTQESHDLHGAGFVRLRELLPDPASFLAQQAINRERRGTRGGRESSELKENNAIHIAIQKAFREEEVIGGAGGKRGRREPAQPTAVDIQCKALVLARQLDDERSLAFYRLVVRKVPEQLIRDALTRALDIPRRDIRRSRGALFASIVREHLPNRQPSHRTLNS